MPSAHLSLKEEEAIRLILEFLSNRDLSISQLAVERETGVINGHYSDDILYLRQLILDGQWDDVLRFIQPLEGFDTFDSKQFRYIVIKHKYIELLCIRSESGPYQNVDVAVDEVVKSLNELEKFCPSKEDYNSLCLLVTLPRLSDHFDYKNWNPSNARVNCFRAVLPLVEKFLPVDKKTVDLQKTAKGDRLIQLIIKGILYESCVEYCQQRATSASTEPQEMGFAHILNGTGFSDSDLSLLSWLQCIPPETFSYPFEQKTLSVDVEQLNKPSLEASWTEQILVTPIKPKIFPYSVMPTRPRTSDFMSKSLTPNLDALGHNRNLMAYSMVDLSNMSRSFAGFHLTGKKAMNTSVDRLFEGGDVFSTSCAELQTVLESPLAPVKGKIPPKIMEQAGSEDNSSSGSKRPSVELEAASVKERINFDSLQPTSIHDRGDVLPEPADNNPSLSMTDGKSMSDLWREFQRHKEQILKELSIAEKREGIIRTALSADDTLEVSELNSTGANPISLPVIGQTRVQHITSTSTPKPVGSREVTPVPQSSPVLPRNGTSSLDSPYSRPSSCAKITGLPQNDANPQQFSSGQPVRTSPAGSHKSLPQSPPASSLSPASGTMVTSPQGSDSPQHRSSPVHGSRISEGMKHGGTLHKGLYDSYDNKKPRFITITRLEDAQAIRAAEFHPSGQLYAIGSNSKTLRVCAYPKINDLREDHVTHQPTVLYKKVKHHKGSIYCLSWNPSGDLLATGSNDKTVKLMKFNMDTCNVDCNEAELTMHDGTVRDMCFIEDTTNKSSLLISGGAGDCKIYVTDCETATPFQALSGHSGHILSLYTWGGAMFVSGSQDRTIRFWDLRTKGCVHLITPPGSGGKGSPVSAISVDPSGRLLVSGQEDATCMLYDIRGSRILQCFRPHTADVRTIRFSSRAYYLLTGSYDHKVVLTDLQGDLTQPLPMIVVAEHADKVIQGRWHPTEFSFLTTSADKTATLWGLPMY